MRGRRRGYNLWPILTNQIRINYLFILEPNYFCFYENFFYKLVLIRFFKNILFYVSVTDWFENIRV